MFIDTAKYISAGRFTSDGKWIHPDRIIDSNEILYMREGEFDFSEGGAVYHLKKDDIFRIEKNLPHRGISYEENVSFYWLHFDGIGSEAELPKRIYEADGSMLKLMFRQLLHFANSSAYPPETNDYMLRLILIEFCRLAENKSVGNTFICEIEEWIRINRNKALSVAIIAEHFGYNPDYLTRLFCEYHKEGLKAYINSSRINYIKELLLSENCTLKEISEAAGFSDYKYFLKFFKYHEELSPTDFRLLYYNTHTNNH